MKIAFKHPDGGVSILSAAPKPMIERVLGPMSDADYEAHILKGMPSDATDIVKLPDDWKDTPAQFCRIVNGTVVTD